MKQLKKVTAIMLLIAMLLTCVTAFAETKAPIAAEQYLYADIDEAGAALGLKKTQEQSDEAYLTMYENESIILGGRNGQVIDITIFNSDYSLYGVTVGMTVEEAEAKLDEQKINHREDKIEETGQQELVFDVPGHEESMGCFDLHEGVVDQANINTDVEEDDVAEAEQPAAEATAKPASKATKPKTENGYLKLTGAAHLRKKADKSSSSLQVLEKGTKLKFSATAKDSRGVTWYKVKNGSKTGWVSSKYCKKISKKEYEKHDKPKEKKAKGVIHLTGRVNVRKAPDKESASLRVFAAGSDLKYTATAKDSRGVVWYKVTADGVTGWISSKYAKKVK